MNHTLSSGDELTVDPLFPFLKRRLIQTTGLAYYADKDDELARRIQRRLSSLGVSDCASYLEIIVDPLRGRLELDALIAEMTIGETYFFRHQEHFDALRNVVLPDLIARNPDRRALHIWCAGCADGPEAYSLAILLKREMASQLADWEVSILGTDLNRNSLERAGEGKFEEWALRATSEDLRRDCFLKEGRSWRIAPRYKQWISFRYHNLADDDPIPSLTNNLTAFDLIVCRNVMIYFGSDLIDKTIQRFHGCLVEGGWLLVGPTEPNMTSFKSFEAVNAPGVTMYRKAQASIALPIERAIARPIAAPSGVRHSHPIRKAAPASQSVESTLTDVRMHADRGDWTDAVRCCEQILRKDGLNSPVYFYHALVLQQLGRHPEAELALKKAIYLDRRSALPHYYLGLLLQSRGEPRQAARSFENAVELLASRNDADIFADADGMTVGEMKKLVKTHLEVLKA